MYVFNTPPKSQAIAMERSGGVIFVLCRNYSKGQATVIRTKARAKVSAIKTTGTAVRTMGSKSTAADSDNSQRSDAIKLQEQW